MTRPSKDVGIPGGERQDSDLAGTGADRVKPRRSRAVARPSRPSDAYAPHKQTASGRPGYGHP